jgi:hypothetical protein
MMAKAKSLPFSQQQQPKSKKKPIVYHNKTFYLTLCTGV